MLAADALNAEQRHSRRRREVTECRPQPVCATDSQFVASARLRPIEARRMSLTDDRGSHGRRDTGADSR